VKTSSSDAANKTMEDRWASATFWSRAALGKDPFGGVAPGGTD
jgi:hypothetical protein